MSDKELIAAALQPTESYREALDKIVTEYDMALYTKEETLDRLSRAAVPDAATEELDKVTLDRLQELAEERGYDKGFAAGWKSGGRTADLLAPKLRKAQAERAAALAAIERVRAVLAEERAWLEHLGEPGDAYPRAVIGIGKVEAALDGAPEPEVKP